MRIRAQVLTLQHYWPHLTPPPHSRLALKRLEEGLKTVFMAILTDLSLRYQWCAFIFVLPNIWRFYRGLETLSIGKALMGTQMIISVAFENSRGENKSSYVFSNFSVLHHHYFKRLYLNSHEFFKVFLRLKRQNGKISTLITRKTLLKTSLIIFTALVVSEQTAYEYGPKRF